jgi:hypothetical protein
MSIAHQSPNNIPSFIKGGVGRRANLAAEDMYRKPDRDRYVSPASNSSKSFVKVSIFCGWKVRAFH